jgi:hypothetical protein
VLIVTDPIDIQKLYKAPVSELSLWQGVAKITGMDKVRD